jgi:hypothetical protein
MGNAGNGHGGNVERFSVDVAVGGEDRELAEGGGVYVGESEGGLFVVECVARVTVVVGEDILRAG